MQKSKVLIIVIDDLVKKSSPLIVKLLQEYETVEVFNNSVDGIDFISKNLSERIIVILDIKLSGNDTNTDGHIVLNKLREISFLIPVIIWSATDERQETFSDFIENRAFAFVKQSTPLTEIIKVVKSAELSLENDVASSLEDWILAHPEDPNSPYLIALSGKEYSLKDILIEVRQQSQLGQEFAYKLNKLTIELLVKNIESLDD